jgi:hypothetical protein
MLLRLTSQLLPDYRKLIDLALDESLPESELGSKNLIYQDLLLDFADCWISYQIIEGVTILKAIGITKLIDNIAAGGRVLTIIATYGFEKLHEEDAIEAFTTIKKFAASYNCYKIDFFTTNERIIEYARLFKINRECTYIQFSFDQPLNEVEV